MHVLLQAEKQGEKTKRMSLESKLKINVREQCNCYIYGPRAKEYNSFKQELEQIYNYITEGIILRTRTDWYEEGKKLIN